MAHSTNPTRTQIFQNILDFYQAQPGVKVEQIEKIEEYLILMEAFYTNAISELDELADETTIEDSFDVLNSYVNAVSEEYEKIFKESDSEFLSFSMISNGEINEVQAIEILEKMNGRENNTLEIETEIQLLADKMFLPEFNEELINLVKLIVSRLHSTVVVRIEDLI